MTFKFVIVGILIICNNLCAQKNPTAFEKNSNYGLVFERKVILPAIYEDVNYKYPFVVAQRKKEIEIYQFDRIKGLKKLYENVKSADYVKNVDGIQILTKDNEVIFLDYDGVVKNISSYPKIEKQPEWTKSLKSNMEITCTITKDNINEYRKYSDKKYNPSSLQYELIKNSKSATFLNEDKYLKISKFSDFEDNLVDDYSDDELYAPLKYSYVIAEVENKYGVWDFKDKKAILPFEYDKIISYQKYLLLEKNGLVTFYPNVGTEPKYKNLESYIGAFTRFETPDGRKGWIDRKGKEYFDQ